MTDITSNSNTNMTTLPAGLTFSLIMASLSKRADDFVKLSTEVYTQKVTQDGEENDATVTSASESPDKECC